MKKAARICFSKAWGGWEVTGMLLVQEQLQGFVPLSQGVRSGRFQRSKVKKNTTESLVWVGGILKLVKFCPLARAGVLV